MATTRRSLGTISSRYLTGPAATMTTADIVRPDWRKWKHAYEVRLHEAIALSLNIAPENVVERRDYRNEDYRYDGAEGEEFARRLFVARRNPRRIRVLRQYGPYLAWVELPRFAAWAQSLGWQLPPELVETIHTDELDAAIPTGMQGRPSKGKDLIWAQFQRRVRENACKLTLDEEAGTLRDWYRNKYPKAQSPTAKTIAKNIRADYRQWLKTRQPDSS